jgi:hypothetical protein
MDVIRIGKVQENGHEVIILELFGIPLAYASTEKMIENFDQDPEDFTRFWSEYFRSELVSMIAEDMQQNRRIQGWGLGTRLSPRLPSLPPEEGEGS